MRGVARIQRLLDLRPCRDHPGDRSAAGKDERFGGVVIQWIPANDRDGRFVRGKCNELMSPQKGIGDGQFGRLQIAKR